VVIDLCPSCRGAWLDGGELEKMVSLASEFRREYEHMDERRYIDDHDRHRDRYDYDDHHKRHHDDYHDKYDDHYYKKKKKRGIMDIFGELFD